MTGGFPPSNLLRLIVGMEREIVPPLGVEKVIQVDGWEQAEIERRLRGELLHDLPRGEVLLVGVGPGEVEVERIGGGFGKEIGTVGERLQIEELIFEIG